MERFGFIHGELDTKILILYVLRQLPSPVDEATLTELCSFDGGVGWFDFKECLASLVSTGHVDKLPGGYYMITDKGRANGEAVESSIPFSVRDKASRLLAPLAARMSRDNMIGASHVSCKAGGVTVTLSLSDGKGEILYMRPPRARRQVRRGHGKALPRRGRGHIRPDSRNTDYRWEELKHENLDTRGLQEHPLSLRHAEGHRPHEAPLRGQFRRRAEPHARLRAALRRRRQRHKTTTSTATSGRSTSR